MSPEHLLALATFALVMSVTPGPNNVMLLASAANFGFGRTLPQMFGVTVGFASVILVTGLGLGALIEAVPMLQLALKYVAAAYLLYLAWRVATSSGHLEVGGSSRPITFMEAVTFQWINPKAWTVAASAVASYGSGGNQSLPTIVAVIAVINLPSIGAWAILGAVIQRPLRRPSVLRAFNVVMGLLLAVSLVPILSA